MIQSLTRQLGTTVFTSEANGVVFYHYLLPKETLAGFYLSVLSRLQPILGIASVILSMVAFLVIFK